MRLVTYDVECFAYNWLVTFKDMETGKFTSVWDDEDALKACINEDSVYFGFNSKNYDQHIIKSIACGGNPQQVKDVNDWIIGGNQGWDYPELKDHYFRFNNADIMDDMQVGQSLKSLEGHLGLPIRESSVPFDIDRPLTEEEKMEVEKYCIHDVDTTEKIIEIRKDYLKNKINLGMLANLSEAKALSMTNAKLTAAMLGAVSKPHDDERKYVYPDNLLREYIPQEVFDYFDRMYDSSISDEELFGEKLSIMIGECPVTLGFGGIHGAIPNFVWEETEERGCKNKDVGSYYPHLIVLNGYASRNIPSPQFYENVLDTRMKAKADGDKVTANALKLVCNTTYGATLNRYNNLYDPLMARSVCISGQLYLLELAMHCYQEIDDLRIVQLNTDGIMVELNRSDFDKLDEICQEWQDRTRFTLEEDVVAKIVQKDVNNYIEVQPDGKVKTKGGYLERGISTAGAFKVNNNACIVATAIKEYFVNGTPVEKTINDCDDIFQFQLIAKAGSKYSEAYHLVNGEKLTVQKVNRVYATSDTSYGKLYKVKKEDGSVAKIESLPEHCIIDNENELTINDVDKSFYIETAKKRVNDFIGIKPEKKTRRKKDMATTTEKKTATKAAPKTAPPMNVYQKLLKARAMFLESDTHKTGKNINIGFKYFELNDIVPTATKIFEEVGLVPIVTFTNEVASMDVINTDNPDEAITFFAPFRQIAPIVSNAGKVVTNEMQALGSSITYMRRYLYMIALDICEADEIDASLGSAPVADKPKTPATPQQRQEVKQELTAPSDKATALQIKGLKAVLKKLKEADPSKEEMITQIAIQTDNFTAISKSDCEQLIERLTGMLEENNG